MGKKYPYWLPPQECPAGDETVLELATAISGDLEKVIQTLRTSNDDSPERAHALERFAELDGYNLEARAKKILVGLAFQQSDFDNQLQNPQWRLDYAGSSCPFIGSGPRSADAR